MNGLFIVGNKRSGSTHLMRLLNLHENVFISNESDIIWVLYCFHNGKDFSDYVHDSPSGMHGSLKVAKSVLDRKLTPQENFFNYQKKLMEEGFLNNKAVNKPDLKYVGDQKPYQNIDPELLPFTLELFPKAKFLHILRHPFEVVSSSLSFGNGTGGDIWKDMSPSEILEKWEMHENWVNEAKTKHDVDLLEVRYSRMVEDPKGLMAEIYTFLDLPYRDDLLELSAAKTVPNYKKIDQYELTDSQKELLNSYSMKTSFSGYEARLRPVILNYFNRGKKKIKAITKANAAD